MSQGYVYILINPMMEGIVKIGWTSRSSEERAKEISGVTGVPTPYVVIHEEYVTDCEVVESQLQDHFAPFRIHPKREFYRIPIKDAVRALTETAIKYRAPSHFEPDYEPSQAIEISHRLRLKYGTYVRPEIASVKIVHKDLTCLLEVTEREYPHSLDVHIVRTDLSFIVDRDRPMFHTGRSIAENANTFINELDPYSIIMCTNLFTFEAATEVSTLFESGSV